MTSPQGPLTIEAVATPAQQEAFIRLPWAIYRDDPQWVPPLLMERRDHLNPQKNPFFQRAEAKFWLALRDGRPVGRISAQVNRAHLERHQDDTGQFGMLEAEDRAETFEALLRTAETWLSERGMKRVTGPFSLSINEESGLLVEGFEHPPSLMMGHAPRYYAPRLEALGYRKVQDLICYRYHSESELPEKTTRLLRKLGESEGLTVRALDMRRYERDLAVIVDIFNDAWRDNWGFIPMTQADLRHLAKELKPIVRPQGIAIAELQGEPVAMAITLPNVNEAIADLNGRLLPFGWAKLLWRLKVRTTKSVRLPLMGVRRAYHGSRLGAALAFAVIERVHREQLRLGAESGELSWILEENRPMCHMIEHFGGVPYKTYRVYGRELA